MMIEEELSNLTINHLTEEQYMNAKANGNINDNELYMTPDDGNNGEGGIIVSPTEPTTDRRKVWFQKGKNYINENLLKIETVNGVTCSIVDGKIVFNGTATNNGCFRIPVFLKKGNYVFSWYGKHIASHFTFRNQNNDYISALEVPEGCDNILTVTTDGEYIVGLNIHKGDAFTASNTSFNIQLEQGTEATEYEEYINHTIYVKNDNDEYEEFIKKNIVRNSKVESTEEAYSCNYINSSLEIEKIEGFFVVKPGYTILFDKIFKQGKHYFGNLIVKKNSGNFTNIQEAVATPSKTLNGNYNTGCFLANNIYASHAIGYCYFGENVVYIADQNEKGYNVAKMNVDIVVN